MALVMSLRFMMGHRTSFLLAFALLQARYPCGSFVTTQQCSWSFEAYTAVLLEFRSMPAIINQEFVSPSTIHQWICPCIGGASAWRELCVPPEMRDVFPHEIEAGNS
jgi:hypothetical protein